MTVDGPVFRLRQRAESFGSVAADYDRFRPGYPLQLIDDLLAGVPAGPDGRVRVLDVGCGTGKAARLLAARGAAVLGVEIDPKMADVARGHGVEVEVSAFEEWDDRGRRFDLVVSGQAWHWVDPALAAPKAAGVLVDGGLLALFWNFDELDPMTQAAVDRVYGRLAPDLERSVVTSGDRHSNRPYVHDLETTGSFTDVETRTYRWQRVLRAADWVGMVGTHSDHLLLGAPLLNRLQADLSAALAAQGGEVRMSGGTYTVLAHPSGEHLTT